MLAEAAAAGAEIPRAGAETFWGGYSGIFVDPDGHPWEVAHNPHWTIRDDGSIELRDDCDVLRAEVTTVLAACGNSRGPSRRIAANALYSGVADLVLLWVDPTARGRARYERPDRARRVRTCTAR